MEGFKPMSKHLACFKKGGHVKKKADGGAVESSAKANSSWGDSGKLDRMSKMVAKKKGGAVKKKAGGALDEKQDKALVKKAIRIHDKEMHGGKTEKLEGLKKGGRAEYKPGKKVKKKADGGPIKVDVPKPADKLTPKPEVSTPKKLLGEQMGLPKKNELGVDSRKYAKGGKTKPKAEAAPKKAKAAKAPVVKKKASVAKSASTEVPVLGSPDAMGAADMPAAPPPAPPAGGAPDMAGAPMAPPMMRHGGTVHHYFHGGPVEHHDMGGMAGAGMGGGLGAMGGAGMAPPAAGGMPGALGGDPRVLAA